MFTPSSPPPSGLEAMEAALALERHVNQSLLDLHAVADKHGDPQVSRGEAFAWDHNGTVIVYCLLTGGHLFIDLLTGGHLSSQLHDAISVCLTSLPSCRWLTSWRLTTSQSRWRPSRRLRVTSATSRGWGQDMESTISTMKPWTIERIAPGNRGPWTVLQCSSSS